MPVDSTINILAWIGAASTTVLVGWGIPRIFIYFLEKRSEVRQIKMDIKNMKEDIKRLEDIRGK